MNVDIVKQLQNTNALASLAVLPLAEKYATNFLLIIFTSNYNDSLPMYFTPVLL